MTEARRLLLFGGTGKMGTALRAALAETYAITGVASRDVDINDAEAVTALVADTAPEVIVNAAGMLGVDPCETAPARAFRMNALFPRQLARLAAERGARLVHFSTDAVFSGRLGRALTEDDEPDPVNQYGASKYAGDVLIRDAAPRHYVFRLPVLFGPGAKRDQLVERMVDRARAGETTLRVAEDVVGSPSYAPDIAVTVARALAEGWEGGLYHLANEGQASLYELIRGVMEGLDLDVRVERAASADFPSAGAKTTVTPLRSTRIPPLRPWREALAAYLGSGG